MKLIITMTVFALLQAGAWIAGLACGFVLCRRAVTIGVDFLPKVLAGTLNKVFGDIQSSIPNMASIFPSVAPFPGRAAVAVDPDCPHVLIRDGVCTVCYRRVCAAPMHESVGIVCILEPGHAGDHSAGLNAGNVDA